jgi:hypothetical protein
MCVVASLLLQASPLLLASLLEDCFPNVACFLNFVGAPILLLASLLLLVPLLMLRCVPAIAGFHTVEDVPAVASTSTVANVLASLLLSGVPCAAGIPSVAHGLP